MSPGLTGKVAFITGGSSGIGLGIARVFAEADMNVVITYRTAEHREHASSYLAPFAHRVHAIAVDVTDRAGMERAAAETTERFGKVHVLVSNAGVSSLRTLSSTTYEEWDWLMGINVNGVFNSVRAFLPRIRRHGEGGHIIATSSVLGLAVPGAHQGAYCVSKFALVGMMEALRAELADSGIGVSVLCPGVVRSNLLREARDAIETSPIPSDPLDVGRQVLEGMHRNDLYILTHPEFEPLIRQRNAAIGAAMTGHPTPGEARVAMVQSMLENSIYTPRG